MIVVLAFYNDEYLNENPFRKDKNKRYGKTSVFVDSEFVKTCDELVIGLLFHKTLMSQLFRVEPLPMSKI